MDDEIMSIAEARQIMNETTADMTDGEVTSLLNSLCLLASAFIESVQFDDKFRVNIEYTRGQKAE